MIRIAVFSVVACIAIAFLATCGDDGATELEKQAQDLAVQFHNAIGNRDEKRLLSLVDYPFNFDNQMTIGDDAELKKIFFEVKRSAVRRAVRAAVKLESATYEQFCDGKPIASRSLEGEAAERQASKLAFREGGVLVRCFYEGEGGKQDARYYILVMHKNGLGDLKITTYYD